MKRDFYVDLPNLKFLFFSSSHISMLLLHVPNLIAKVRLIYHSISPDTGATSDSDGAPCAWADPGFFLGGGALVSRSTSTPINHIVFFFAE